MDKIPVTGLISPLYPNDNYPITDPRFGLEGLRNLDTLSEMYNIPMEKRRAGMVVGIPNTSSNTVAYYKLKPEGGSTTWSVGQASDWDGFFSSGTGSVAVPVKYLISNETITNPTNYAYIIWGGMEVGQSGSFINDGKAYFINGTMTTTSDGTFSGSGNRYYVNVPTKYTESFQSSTFGYTVSHNLNTEDIVYSVRDNTNFVTVNAEILNANQIQIYSNYTFTAKITIIG